MMTRIQITTPPGAAKGFDNQVHMSLIKRLIVGKSILKYEYISPDNSVIYWGLDCSAAQFLKIQRNLTIFSTMLDAIFTNKLATKSLRKMADCPADYDEMVRMMKSGTKVEMVRAADWAEIEKELNKPGWWDRLKGQFRAGPA